MTQFAHSRLIMAVAGDLEFFKGTVDYLEADRLDRIAAQVQRSCVSKLWKLSQYAWAVQPVLDIIDTPS